MKPPQARVFLEGVLLDAIREDIRLTKEGSRKAKNHRKLNVHYYESLKRALYKPAAFFKGIVFPLLQVRLCVLVRVGVVLRSVGSDGVYAAGSCHRRLGAGESESTPASFGCCVVKAGRDGLLRYGGSFRRRRETDRVITGPNSLFIRILLDKKYALPYKVVDGLVFHFIRLSNQYKPRSSGDAQDLPVLWHQSLLVFCQR